MNAGENIEFQIFGNDGKRWRDATIRGGESVWTGDLPAGFYIVKARKKGEEWQLARLVKQ